MVSGLSEAQIAHRRLAIVALVNEMLGAGLEARIHGAVRRLATVASETFDATVDALRVSIVTARPKRTIASVVYFVEDGAGNIKIGRTRDMVVRLAMLQNAHATPLHLIGTMPGSVTHERALHRRFAGDRIRGEWFRGTPALRAKISDLVATQNGASYASEPTPSKPDPEAAP